MRSWMMWPFVPIWGIPTTSRCMEIQFSWIGFILLHVNEYLHVTCAHAPISPTLASFDLFGLHNITSQSFMVFSLICKKLWTWLRFLKNNCVSFKMVFNCIYWINMLAILLVSFWITYEIVLINLTFSHNDLSHNFNFVHTLHKNTFPTCGACPWNDLFGTHGQGFYLGSFDCYKENVFLHIQSYPVSPILNFFSQHNYLPIDLWFPRKGKYE